jgi:predicted nucleic acid-binding protein
MSVLVDSSVWVDYFRRHDQIDDRLDWLITEGLVATNELILAELIPPLIVRKHTRLVALMRSIPGLPLHIDWPGLIADQVACMQAGVNKVGLPDLIIAQNAKQHRVAVFSHDKHFRLMAAHTGLELF